MVTLEHIASQRLVMNRATKGNTCLLCVPLMIMALSVIARPTSTSQREAAATNVPYPQNQHARRTDARARKSKRKYPPPNGWRTPNVLDEDARSRWQCSILNR